MTHIAEIDIVNWGPFRGRTILKLAPVIYGLIAEYETDPRRSNAGGKSMLGEAPLYCFWGWTAPERGFDASGWITDGQSEGSVRVALSDGWWVKRSRTKRTWDLETASGAHKDRAQEEIDQRLVLSRDDLLATRVVRQKQADRFARAESGRRMEIVSEWLRLEKLEACAEEAGARAKLAEDSLEELRRKAADARSTYRRVHAELGLYDPERDEVLFDEDDFLRGLVEDEEAAEKAVADAERLARGAELVREYRRLDAEREQVVEQGRKARKLREGAGVPTDAELGAAKAKLDAAALLLAEVEREADRKKRVSLGLFDGSCPVAKIACPVQAQINADRVGNTAEHQRAREAVRVARESWDASDEVYQDLLQVWKRAQVLDQEVGHWLAQHAGLTSKLSALAEKIETGGGDELLVLEAEEALPELRERDRIAYARREAAERQLDFARSELGRSKGLDAQAVAKEEEARLAREAQAVFRAARSRIAEQALGEVEEGANRALAELDPGIGFELRWSREGKELAKACSRCGRAFGRGRSEKQCSCGEPRGRAAREVLDFVFRDQSGGTEDLCGLFAQLAAGAWLCADRGCPHTWAVVDEPGAHLDAALRGALAHKLPRMLGQLGVEQAVVIAHDSAAIDALPGRILVQRGTDGYSTARVIA